MDVWNTLGSRCTNVAGSLGYLYGVVVSENEFLHLVPLCDIAQTDSRDTAFREIEFKIFWDKICFCQHVS